jgi:hypothetical protein
MTALTFGVVRHLLPNRLAPARAHSSHSEWAGLRHHGGASRR